MQIPGICNFLKLILHGYTPDEWMFHFDFFSLNENIENVYKNENAYELDYSAIYRVFLQSSALNCDIPCIVLFSVDTHCCIAL